MSLLSTLQWNFIFPTHSECSIWRYVVIPSVSLHIRKRYRFSKKVQLELDIFMNTRHGIYNSRFRINHENILVNAILDVPLQLGRLLHRHSLGSLHYRAPCMQI